jgi:sodium/bile acid cotransporter 7
MKKVDWFLIGLFAATGLAFLFPHPGAHGGWLHAETLNKVGIALIFFLHGVALSFAALKAGTLRWPLHLVVQLCTFLFFPLVGFVLMALTAGRVDEDLRLGFFFLCALPSAVSSSVAMTAAARGNVAAAVFNATLSSLLGVFLTPLWISFLLRHGTTPMPLGKVILDLVFWLILPLVVGQLCRPLIGAWMSRRKKWIHIADRGTILMLVYTAFCDSVKSGVWSGHGPGTLLLVVAVALGLFYLVMTAVGLACRVMKLPEEDRIAAVFCGSKKSLASGIPMAQIIFRTHPGIGMIVLPIMIYHASQLIICAVLAGRWAKRRPEAQIAA